ncbi:MAG: hypothetical protein WC382_04220 [Methanoregulaceae archaeon]|jgi:hypothetical protein
MELHNNSQTFIFPCENNRKFGLYFSHPGYDLNALPKCDFNSLKEYFSQLDQIDLVSIIGGLQIHPCNHVHQVRLITSQYIACSLKNPINPLKIKSDNFRSLINQYLPTISEVGLKEDPPERLFTENIAFHGGNYIVYSSIFHDENQYLTSIFHTLEFFQDQFPIAFFQDILIKSTLILAISNEIASRLNHLRYMDSPYSWKSNRTDIFVPQDDELRRYAESIVFTVEQLKKLDPNFTIDKIKPFLQKLGKKEFNKINLENSIFYRFPIVYQDNELVIVAPGALLIALRHYIWTSARRYKIEKLLAKKYREILWLNVRKYLLYMKFEELNELSFNPPTDFPINEGFFKIDTNKIAFVQLITDDCLKYKNNEPQGIWDTQDLILKIRERDEEIIESFREKGNDFKEIFIIKIFGSIGRSSKIRYVNIESIRTLLLTYTELEAVAKSGRVDNLTLWKYVKADDDAKKFFNYFSFSFLDKFTLYCNNRTLIYDFRAMSHPMLPVPIPVGIGKDLRVKVIKQWDTHLELIGDPSAYISVENANQDPLVPIYISEYPVEGKICFLIKGYKQPIWIIYGEQLEQIQIGDIELVQDFCKSIAYWIWQFTPKLRDYLLNLGEKPLHIIIKFRNPEVWYNYHDTFFSLDTPVDPIQYITNNRFATIIIPDNFLKEIANQNNHGERLLCRALLLALSKILAEYADNFSLTNGVIEEIINDYAPLGRKKQILSVFAGVEGLLINNNLPEARWLEKHDIQEQSLNLLNKLALRNLKDGVISENQSIICNSIVEFYYRQLILKITEYNWKSLLELLIGQHDSMLHHGILVNFFSTFIIESYSNQADVVKKIAEQLPIIDQSTLCIRTLIEIIAAQPPKGNKTINIDDFDHLMALSYHLIRWGNLSNFYYHGFLHQNLKIGIGGRIFVEEDDFFEKFSYFTREKVSESVYVSFDRFKGELKAEKNTEPIQINPQEIEELDIASNAEFGLSFQEIMNFFFCLIHSMELFICPEQVGPVYFLPKSLLISRLMKKLNWSEVKVYRALEEFSLHQCESLEEFKDDFKPWKYCRRLAPSSRPLIIGPEPEGDPIIMWGSLHSERSLKYLIELIMTGRFDTSQSSSEMRSYIAKIQKERGEAFNDYIQKWFKDNTSFVIHPRVNLPIKDKTNEHSENLGDIDILAIDEEEKVIYSFECKNINFGRNSSEIINEMTRLLKGTNDEESWLKRHSDRDEWLKNNLSKIISKYSLKSKIYSLKSIIITAEAVPSIFLTDTDYSIPIIPFTQIEREGISSLTDRLVSQ